MMIINGESCINNDGFGATSEPPRMKTASRLAGGSLVCPLAAYRCVFVFKMTISY